MSNLVEKINLCRACKKKSLRKIVSLGPHPNANTYPTKAKIDSEELYFPLDVYLCTSCSYLQLGHAINPRYLFEDYVYVSSTSEIFVNHFVEYANNIYNKIELNKDSLVIDIGSNDGILLLPFKKLGVKILGVDPNIEISANAINRGIPTIQKYFNQAVAKKILKDKGKAKVICANNTFAQINDSDELIKGVDLLLESNGIFVIEVPYVVDMLKKGYFDLIYHEHHAFPSVRGLNELFKRFDMQIFDVERKNVHGGTIRVYIKKKSGKYAVTKRVGDLINLEKRLNLSSVETYSKFFQKVEKNRIDLLKLVLKLKSKNKKIYGYGAPAKANTLLNYFNIGIDFIDKIIDDNTWKQGRFSPGKKIPIINSSVLKKENPDYVIILAWNFANSIIAKNQDYKKQGGKFIIPFPKPRIV